MKAIMNTGPISAFDVNAKPAPQKEELWRYGVRVRGVKKRCRKVEWHIEVGKGNGKGLGESQAFDPDLAKSLAQKWLSENMKSFDQAFATAWLIEYDSATGMETWQMMNDDHNKRIQLS